MGEPNFATSYPFALTFQVTVPGNGGGVSSAQNIYNLLTAGQKALLDSGLTNGLRVMQMQATPQAAVNYYHAAPGNGPTWAVDATNAGAFPVAINQKPNETIAIQAADKRLFWLSASATPVVMSVTLYCVSNSAL